MDTVLSVRVDENKKQEFIQYAKKLGVNNKEFLESLMKNFEINNEINANSNNQNDLDELRNITNRMYGIFLNNIERNKTIVTQKEGEFKSKISLKDIEITELSQKNEELLKKIDEIKKVENKLKILQNANEKLSNDYSDIKSLNGLLQEKLNNVLNDIGEAKKLSELYHSQNDQLKKKEDEISSLKQQIDSLKLQRESSEITFARLKDEYTLKNSELLGNHKKEIEYLELNWRTKLKETELDIRNEMTQSIINEKETLLSTIQKVQTELHEKNHRILELEKHMFEISKEAKEKK